MTRSDQNPTMQTAVPTVHISEAPREANKLQKMEHRRWNSEPERKRMAVKPFAYEYKFEDGRLAGLAEYHPDDYWHYSSSRNNSTSVSRNHSSRTSRDETHGRASMDNRRLSAGQTSDISQGPPPSPGKIDGIKRALTLHTLKRRASSEVKKTPPPSPYSRPEIERLAASFGRKGPQHITSPMPSLPEPKPVGMFEQPRTAPQPPSRETPKHSPRFEQLHETKGHPFAPLERKDSGHDVTLPLRSPSISPKMPATSSFVVSRPNTHVASRAARSVEAEPAEHRSQPLLRRKTSKFVEHIENKEGSTVGAVDPQAEDIPPVPPMVIRGSELILPIQGAFLTDPSPSNSPLQGSSSGPRSPKSPTVRFAPLSPKADATLFNPGTTGKSMGSAMRKPSTERMDETASQAATALKRSSTMKSLPPAPRQVLRRATSTRARVPPGVADVRLAEVKPILMSPVVAQGHARMISC